MLATETGEWVERRLEHENGEARAFYARLPSPARVGMEATAPARGFERLLGECGYELWVGDAARLRASQVRQQKTGPRHAEPLLDLLLTNRFPRLGVPSLEERDARPLLPHRHPRVGMRTSVENP